MLNIDWLNCSQKWPSVIDANGEIIKPLPVVESGIVGKFTDKSVQDFLASYASNPDKGELDFTDIVTQASDWASSSRVIHEGSFDSSLWLGCDGNTVEFRGNPARHNRPDNVFTGDLAHALACANAVTASYGLPPFSAGEYTDWRDSDGELRHGWTGATVSMIHLNKKFATGSPENCEALLSWAKFQNMPNVHCRPQENGAVWGSKGSTRKMIKLYGKAREMLAHAKKHGRKKSDVLKDPVYQYCYENGIVCLELEARRQMLSDKGLRHLGDMTMEKLDKLFTEEAQILFNRASNVSHNFDVTLMDVPTGAQMAAMAWLAGDNPWPALLAKSRATAYRHAKALREYGIDITIPLDPDNPIPPPFVRVVDVMAITEPPAWYWEHQARMAAAAANSDPYQVQEAA